MRIVKFEKVLGTRDIYDYFDDLAEKHELKYFNTVETPRDAAFGFINSTMVTSSLSRSDLASYMKYITYTITLESEEKAKEVFDRFGDLLEQKMQDIQCVYTYENDKLIAVFNALDMNLPPKPFEKTYEVTLRNIIVGA